MVMSQQQQQPRKRQNTQSMNSTDEQDSIPMRESVDFDNDRTNLLGGNTNKYNKSSKTITWTELPHWMQDNIFITSGYRLPTGSYKKCIQSLFYLHNESGPCSISLSFIIYYGILSFYYYERLILFS